MAGVNFIKFAMWPTLAFQKGHVAINREDAIILFIISILMVWCVGLQFSTTCLDLKVFSVELCVLE